MRRVSLLLLLTASVLGSVAVFGTELPSNNLPPLEQMFPGPLKNAWSGKIVPGELTGDLDLDAVVMDGSEPVLVFAPEVFDAALRTGATANDFDFY